MARIKISYPEKTIYEHNSRIRIGDLGPSGHLAFDSLVGILNDASVGFFKANGIERGNRSSPGVIYTDLAVNYLKEAFYGDTLQIEMAVGDVGSKGFDLLFRVNCVEKGKVVALAKIGILFFDYQNQRAINMPEFFRLLLDPIRESAPEKKSI